MVSSTAFTLKYWYCRLEEKVQVIDERTQCPPTAAPTSKEPDGSASLGTRGECQVDARKNIGCVKNGAVSTGPQASGFSARQLQSPRQRMLETYKQLFFDVVPDTRMLEVAEPVAEGSGKRRQSTVRCSLYRLYVNESYIGHRIQTTTSIRTGYKMLVQGYACLNDLYCSLCCNCL